MKKETKQKTTDETKWKMMKHLSNISLKKSEKEQSFLLLFLIFDVIFFFFFHFSFL